MNFTMHHFVLSPTLQSSELAPFGELVRNCQLWWASKGVYLECPPIELVRTHPIDVTGDNPWNQALSWWLGRPEYTVDGLAVVLLHGWDSQLYIGWGGRPLALVGDYAIKRLLSRPTTPDDPTDAADGAAIVDDWVAGELLLHEEGHALGLSHDFTTPGAVMNYSQHQGFNSVLGPVSAQELERVWTPRAHTRTQACVRPA